MRDREYLEQRIKSLEIEIKESSIKLRVAIAEFNAIIKAKEDEIACIEMQLREPVVIY